MKILRLELFGFKSFREKTIVSFDQPITAIVGSNGCGKSNIVDALYWVMGDMSPKHLRGNKMVDVIFSGSRDYAALDMAEVTLVLERAEGDPPLPPQFEEMKDIQITRRYYRSGDSEYFINKTQCRLRDIQEFFMDTGVGAKAYSIIEQGAITRMVQQKPEDRRMVIEEVAGIMKFKARRAETERKLEHTQSNLTRIDDILKDLQKSLNTLRRQADRAEKYSDYTKELKNLELHLAAKQWQEHRSSKEKKSEFQITIKEQLEEFEADLVKYRHSSSELREEVVRLEGELNEKRAAHRSAELTLKDLESGLSNLSTKKESFENRIQESEEQEVKLQERDRELDEEIQKLDSGIDGWVVEASEYKDQLEQAKAAVQEKRELSDRLREELDAIRKDFHAAEVEETKLNEKIENKQNAQRELRQRQEKIELQLSEVHSETQVHEAEKKSTTVFLEEAFSKRSDLETAKQRLDEQLTQEEELRAELQEKRNKARDELSHVRIRREHLEALDRNLEGVDAATKAVALRIRERGNEKSLLADRVEAPELLEKSVEAVLGHNLQRAFAENIGDVRELRRELSNSNDTDARRGRSRFWVDSIFAAQDSFEVKLDEYMVSDIQGSSSPEAEQPGPDGMISQSQVTASAQRSLHSVLLQDEDVLGPLSDLVEEKSTQEYAWTKLLKRVWVVKDIATIDRITSVCKSKLPIDLVSLDGDLLTRDGLMDLAALESSQDEASQSLVQRRNETNRLSKEQQELEEKLGSLESDLRNSENKVENTKSEIKRLTGQLVELNPDLEKHSEFLRQVEAKIARLQQKNELMRNEVDESRGKASEISQSLEEATSALKEWEEKKTALERDLLEKEAAFGEASANFKYKEEEREEAERKFQEVNQKLQEKRNDLAALKQERRLSQTRHEQITSERKRLVAELAQVDEVIASKEEELRTEKEKVAAVAKVERDHQNTVSEAKEKLEKAQAKVEELLRDTQKMHHDLKELEQQSMVHDVEIKNIEERITEKYQVKLGELPYADLREILSPSDLEDMADANAAKDRLEQLRAKLDRLGKINMVAKEEFDEKRQRYEYLFIQKKDVEDAISQLREAIEKIDVESRERFAQSFNAVNEAFQTTFPVLFGGGNAELRLTDPENLLESGVEIVAQPPGKKLQSVTLLSGGEKALTAVSLIFGIFSIKPSPFCVLDEVDAPLDDTNVGRFNTQVRNMSETSQIIMITHHKKTMERSDALFGVTMQQPGVSKIASAKLGNIKQA